MATRIQSQPVLTAIEYTASSDDTTQPARILRSPLCHPQPLLVILHTWSADWIQNVDSYAWQAFRRQWHAVVPNFRGPNRSPLACGSTVAMQDIIDAIDWARSNLAVDENRIYLVGGSGGGHMTLQTVCHHPQYFAAASVWCPITDIATWYREHVREGVADRYAQDIEQCVLGRPGDSVVIDADLRARSPRYHITGAATVPLDINHGVHDGRNGSVSFQHSIWAFNALAKHHNAKGVSDAEAQQLDQDGRLATPRPGDTAPDPAYEQAIHLRRHAGPARLTIFEGGHDALPAAAVHWLAQRGRDGTTFSDQRHPPPDHIAVTSIQR